VNVDLVSKFVASVQGLTFSVRVTDKIIGTVRVDFGVEVDLYKRIARELFLELLEEQGVAISGMETWETTYGDKSMTLSGPLTTTDLRRILSLFAFPGPSGEDEPMIKPGEVSVPATQRYLAAVGVVLSDLRSTKDSPDFTKVATWYEKAAEQLAQLGRRGVDPLAVEATHEAGRRLRAIASSLRGVPIDLEALDKKSYYYSQPNVGVALNWWGHIGLAFGPNRVETNLPQIREQQAKVIADDQRHRVQVWSQIDQLMANARLKLGEKHKAKF
jgi:hypothetical protein